MYVYMYVCMYVYMYVCMYVCMYVYMYVCMYVHSTSILTQHCDLGEGLISLSELDPLGLHLSHAQHHPSHSDIALPLRFSAPGHDVVIQVALISETTRCVGVWFSRCVGVWFSRCVGVWFSRCGGVVQ